LVLEGFALPLTSNGGLQSRVLYVAVESALIDKGKAMLLVRQYFAIVIVVLMTGCTALDKMAGRPTNEGNGYVIDHDRRIYGGGIHIEYRDPTFLEQQLKKRMVNQMASGAEIQQATSRIPAGGRILIHYEALSMDAANTEWLEYAIFKNSKEIYRREGSNNIAEAPTSYSGGIGYCWNTDSIDIREKIETPFQLVVISNLKNERDTFTISQ
jgi:hypothetical protein